MLKQQIESSVNRTVAISLRQIERLGIGSHVESCTGSIHTVHANHCGRLVMSHVAFGKTYVDNVKYKDASRFLRFLIVEGPSPDPGPNRPRPISPKRHKQSNSTPPAANAALDAQPEAAQSLPDSITKGKAYQGLDALLAFQVGDSASAVADVLADLMYWSQAHAVDFEDSLERARGYYANHI